MLPDIIQKYCNKIPLNRKSNEFKELVELWQKHNISIEAINSMKLLTQEERKDVLNQIGIKNETFIQYFVDGYDLPSQKKGEELLTLNQIEKYYKEPYMLSELESKYPNASKRYLQLTSIEGGGSYFYDKETDYVYDVTWGEEEAMIIGEKEPWFTSFYDFLEWYYGEEDEK